jgi:hypothetical protein
MSEGTWEQTIGPLKRGYLADGQAWCVPSSNWVFSGFRRGVEIGRLARLFGSKAELSYWSKTQTLSLKVLAREWIHD